MTYLQCLNTANLGGRLIQEMENNLYGKLTITNYGLLDIGNADIIVNSAMAKPACGDPGTVDSAIYKAAGKEMLSERKALGNDGYLKCSECVSTNSYALKNKGIQRIIHVNVPSYFRNKNATVNTNIKLLECYYNVLCEAISYEDGPHTVAFPLLGTGKKGFNYPTAVGLMQIGISSFFSSISISAKSFNSGSFIISLASSYKHFNETIAPFFSVTFKALTPLLPR